MPATGRPATGGTTSSDLQLVVFAVGDRRCALELAAVERVEPMVAVRPLPGAPDGVLGAIDVHGSAVPVLDLRGRLGLPPVDPHPDASLLLARTSRRTVALPVDEVLGLQAVDASAVTSPETLDLPPGSAGVVGLPEGLLLIHDVEGFLSPEAERRLGPALAGTSR
jgi:purine-binding chemotaxis protein CheW